MHDIHAGRTVTGHTGVVTLPNIPVATLTADEGHEGVRELAADWRDAWERMDVLPEEILDAGDLVVVLGRSRVRARMTAIEFESPMASVVWIDRGAIVRQCDFTDWDAALSAAGISAAPARRDPVRVTKR